MSRHIQTTVDVEPLRRAFLEKNIKPVDLAREFGVYKSNGQPDGNYFSRLLGLKPYWPAPDRSPRLRERISYENAHKLAIAIGVDPVDLGI